MTGYEYDYNDLKIRVMIEEDHRPTQEWLGDGTPVGPPTCKACGGQWPCRPEVGLRAWREVAREREEVEMQKYAEQWKKHAVVQPITAEEVSGMKWRSP